MMLFLTLFNRFLVSLATCPINSSTCTVSSTSYITCDSSRFLVDSKICADSCPSLFTTSTNLCTSTSTNCDVPTTANAVVFRLLFSTVTDLTLSSIASDVDNTELFQNPGGVSYNSQTQNSPLPTVDRGFYFATTSSITSSKSHIPGPYFILNTWIKPQSGGAGQFFVVSYNSKNYIRCYYDTELMKIDIIAQSSTGSGETTKTIQSAVQASHWWQQLSIQFAQSDCSTLGVTFWFNAAFVAVAPFSSVEASFPNSNSYTWTIGKGGGNNSFNGFIWFIEVRYDGTKNYGASFTPNARECFVNAYWNGSSCISCPTNCSGWPWCTSATSCAGCGIADCGTCPAYGSSTCTSCITGVLPNCCDILATTCTQTWSNTACQTGKVLVQGVCLYACPYGFGNCASVSSAVITADFLTSFAGSYGTALITGASASSYYFWNSPEGADPIPAKYRGLYFNGSAYLSGLINLSHTWSMAFWVYAMSGTIIGHSTGQLSLSSSGTLSFDLQKWDATYASYTASHSIPAGTWKYVSYSVGFASKTSTITPYLNNAAGTATTATNYVFRLPAGETLYIGKSGSTYFNGFISYFQLWGVTITGFSSGYNYYGFSGGVVSSLWPCAFNQYYDGSACQPCLGTCTNGCARANSCNICVNDLCTKCNNYSSGTCYECVTHASGVTCACDSGYYQPSGLAQCDISVCYSTCSTCLASSSAYYQCTACQTNYYLFLSSMCISSCPSGYTTETSSCTFSSSISLSLSFYDQILLNSVSGVQVGSSSSNTYPSYDGNDPYPAYLRGYYFSGTNYLSTSTVIGPYFTISIWIFPTAYGIIATKVVSGCEIFCLEILSGTGYPKLSVVWADSSTFSVTLSSNVITNSWNFIVFTGKQDSTYATAINSYLNSATKDSGLSSGLTFFQDNSSGTLYIGTMETFTGGFTGFLYNINIFNQGNLQLNDYTTSSCTLPCTSCPSDHGCPNTCAFSKYYNGSNCIDCVSCPKGCRYTDTCGLCKTKQCYSCTTFTGTCSSCITNAESDGSGGCQCEANAFWQSTTATCDFCDALCAICKQTTYFECNTCAAGKQMVGIICLNDCPYGYGTSCSSVTTAVIDQSFDTDFQGSYGIFTTGTSSSTYQPFVTPETIDPVPAYKRGLYFDGSMYLLSSTSVYLSHSFYMGLWIYVITYGDLLQKQTRLTVSSAGTITAIVESTAQVASTQTLTPSSTFTGWAYVSFCVWYSSNATPISLYINGAAAGSITISGNIFRDQASTSLQLGKSSSSTGFVGFIYYFHLYNTQITNFASLYSGFTFCGSGTSCLWSCDISTYKNSGSYLACSTCSKGCVRANTCNVCNDVLCSVCTGFDSGKCTTCVTNASKNPTNCVCNSGYRTSNDGFSCVACSSGCNTCTGDGYYQCTSCTSGKYFLNIQCLSECPSGYTQNSSTKNCDLTTASFPFSFSNIILLGSVSGSDVGSLATNAYPTYDSNDPYPAYLRGYYFNPTSYMKASFMFAPNFSISIWIKAEAEGYVLAKYRGGSVKGSVSIKSTGEPTISFPLSDSSSTITLDGASSVLNSWYYVSFNWKINADGTTTVSSYINGGSLLSASSATPLYLQDSSSGSFYMGYSSAGFKGFLWKTTIYPQEGHASDDLLIGGCSGTCARCPVDLSCPDDCPMTQFYSGSGCTTCKGNNCPKGCRNTDTCRICKTRECATCTSFTGGNSCLTCITNAVSDGSGGCTCAFNAFWVSSSETCEICDLACSTCLKTTYFECSTCLVSYQLVGTVCLNSCPYGTSCSSVTTPVINLSFDADFQGSYGIFATGTNSATYQFFYSPESVDPIPAYKRGLYFNGNMYLLSSATVLLSHSFSIGAWIYVKTDGNLLEKPSRFILSSTGSISATMTDPSQATSPQSLSSGTTLTNWNYLSVTFSYTSDITTLTIYVNGGSVATLPITNYILRDLSSTYLMIGKSSSSSGFVGFINSFQLWNSPISSFTAYINAPCGSGHACLWSCDLTSYYGGAICTSCNSCSSGCVNGNSCHICDDILCSVCTGFSSGKCTQCVSNASLSPTTCVCNEGYRTSDDGFSCVACPAGCSHCYKDVASDKCSSCLSDYIYSSSTQLCTFGCPIGYSKVNGQCVLITTLIFDLNLNTLEGVIYDAASLVPVVTGSTEQFYPDYEVDDPIPAYLRGFWFNGQTSILRLPDYGAYTSPKITLIPYFTISVWLNTETQNAAILSKNDASNSYSIVYSINLMSGQPVFTLFINSSQFLYISQKSLSYYEWSHLSITANVDGNGNTIITCYINGIKDSDATVSGSSFQDITTSTVMAIAAQTGNGNTIYNYFKGFIYQVQIYKGIKSILSLSTTSCTESCSVCPITQICIPNCKITQYWSGPGYNVCYQCNVKCTESCRNWRSTCSLCSNLLCDTCTDYSSTGCTACKENAINTDSCICGENYVLDYSNNSTCVPLTPGGFRGSDGLFYSCPNYCTYCESLSKCTACVEHASLKNDLCYCNLGYNGASSCALVSFSARLYVFDDNSLDLLFSDALANILTENDFTIKIENKTDATWKLEKLNDTSYYISLSIDKVISKGSEVTLTFFNLTDIISVSGGILNSSSLSSELYAYDPAPYTAEISAIASQTKAAVQVGVALAAALSVVNPTPSSLWSMMNALQILSYLTLSGIPLSSKMIAFLNSLNSYNLFPNAFEFVIDKNEGNTPYSQAQDFGFDTDLILLNAGNDFTILLASLAVFPAVFVFSRCSYRWFGNKFMKTLRNYQYAFYLRFWIQSYLELGASAIIGLLTSRWSNSTQITNFGTCSIVYLLLAVSPPLFFYFSYKNKHKIQSQNKEFTSLFSSFFYEFRTDKGLLGTQYYFVFFTRRLIYITNLIYLYNYPQTQVTINVVISLITVMYLSFYWPYEDKILQVSNLITEMMIGLIMGGISIYLFEVDNSTVTDVESAIIVAVVFTMAVQASSSVAIFARTLYEIIRKKLTKNGMLKATVKPFTKKMKKAHL
ncbi:unnamed protein product [Blepharisma stoltei]|uniref:TNFR-Cys domain-containing protein n=1 Tax=Blepharisma stoltei TaxID=1481888 RepID=A0AAU9KCZ4_9CILI|nr:unnamed protein product [Blepharisma stoltei]